MFRATDDDALRVNVIEGRGLIDAGSFFDEYELAQADFLRRYSVETISEDDSLFVIGLKEPSTIGSSAGARVSDPTRRRIVQLYEAGAHPRNIAADVGRSVPTVYNVLRERCSSWQATCQLTGSNDRKLASRGRFPFLAALS